MRLNFENKQIAETLGVVALIASLVFVGMQLQLDREVARVALYHQALEQSTDAMDEGTLELLLRYPELDELEILRLRAAITRMLFTHELIYDMSLNGLVDDDHWSSMFDNNLIILQTPAFMDTLRRRPGILSKQFLGYLIARLED